MKSVSCAQLRQKLRDAEAERDYYLGLVGAFRDGQVPDVGASLQHFIFAQWGRKRLAELKGVPALLRGKVL